jgi:hypothetical protein
MKMTDLRAKARAIFGPAFAEPMPNQPNGAKALQQRANARPIPTYKVGGPVKKPMPTPADLAAAKAQNEMIKKATVSKKEAAAIAAGNNASALTGAEMRKMKMKTGGKVQTSSDTARKLATEMGGMKKGGKAKPKDGLAVMIAIGKPMKPAKKMNGGPMAAGSMDREASKVTREMAMGGSPMGYAAGGAGKTRKGQAPIKKAQGGAAKVRKGMMTPEGDIINVMNKMRGK